MWADRDMRTVGVYGKKEKWENEEKVGKTSESLYLPEPKSIAPSLSFSLLEFRGQQISLLATKGPPPL